MENTYYKGKLLFVAVILANVAAIVTTGTAVVVHTALKIVFGG
jgi:hypothetical protein